MKSYSLQGFKELKYIFMWTVGSECPAWPGQSLGQPWLDLWALARNGSDPAWRYGLAQVNIIRRDVVGLAGDTYTYTISPADPGLLGVLLLW